MDAAAKPSKPVTVIDYSCITEPYAQLRVLRGMQILDRRIRRPSCKVASRQCRWFGGCDW
jgi:hypothetical protein